MHKKYQSMWSMGGQNHSIMVKRGKSVNHWCL